MQSQYAQRLINAPDAEVDEQMDLVGSVTLTSSSIFDGRKTPRIIASLKDLVVVGLQQFVEDYDAARVWLVVGFAKRGVEARRVGVVGGGVRVERNLPRAT